MVTELRKLEIELTKIFKRIATLIELRTKEKYDIQVGTFQGHMVYLCANQNDYFYLDNIYFSAIPHFSDIRKGEDIKKDILLIFDEIIGTEEDRIARISEVIEEIKDIEL